MSAEIKIEDDKARSGINSILDLLPYLISEDIRQERKAEIENDNEKSAKLRGKIRELLTRTEHIFGMPWSELIKNSAATTSPNPEHEEFKDSIRKSVVNYFDPEGKYDEEEILNRIDRFGLKANEILDDIFNEYFLNDDNALLHEEVKSNNDVAELALTAVNNKSKQIRFEAGLKLRMMEIASQLEKEETDKATRANHRRARPDMINFLNTHIFEPSPDGEATKRMLLLSAHDPQRNYAVTSTKILDEEPKQLFDGEKITALRTRRAIIQDEDGHELEMNVHFEQRKKKPRARIIKAARNGSELGVEDDDLNGARMIFENKEDMDKFVPYYLKKIREDICMNLQKRLDIIKNDPDKKELRGLLEWRLAHPETCYQILEEKNTLDGSEFKGSDKASSGKLRIRKFKLKLWLSNGKKTDYEWQGLTKDGYAEMQYNLDLAVDVFDFKRFHENGVGKLFRPEKLHPDLNHQAIYKRGLEQRKRRVWPNYRESEKMKYEAKEEAGQQTLFPDPKK